MSRVLIGNLPPGTTIRNIDDFCSPFGRLLYVDVKNQGNSTLACVEYDSNRNAQNLVRARHGQNYNGYTVQLKVMCDDSGPSSGPFEVRQQNSSAPSPPMWSKSNTQSNNRMYDNSGNNMNRMPSSSFDNRSNNYYNNSNMNSNRGGFGPSSSMDNNSGNLDYNTACRMVYERFLNEGFNPKLAKERTLEFLSNMQGRSNHTGFTNNNISDYFDQTQRGGGGDMFSNNSGFFGPGQGMMNANNNGNFGRFNDNNNWGGNNGGGGSWGSFNGPNNNMQMPSSWGGGGGGMPYNTQGNNFNNRSRRDGWNNQNMMPPQQGPPPNVVDHASYLKSASIRKKIELKITSGISTPRDLKNLQFHTQIMDDYERNLRYQKKLAAKGSKESPAELRNLQRYRSALGIVQKLKKRPQGTLTPEEKKTLASNKVIVDEFEAVITASQAVKGRGGKALPAGGSRPDLGAKAFERKKQQLLREAKKNYPNDFRLSGAAKRKMRSLVAAGIETEEAKLLALHSALVVKELISLKNATIRNGAANGADRNKQLVPVGNFKPGATKGKPNPGGNPKPAVPVPVDPAAGRIHEMSKKERAGMRSANRLLFNYESNNADIESLTERDIALLRMSLRRLKVYHEKYDTPLRETKFDVLLSDKYAKKKDEDKSEGKEDKEEVMEEGNNDDAEGGEDAGQEDDQAEGDGEGAAEGEGEEAAEGDGDAEEEAVDDQAEEEEE